MIFFCRKEEGPKKCIDKVCRTEEDLNKTREHPEEYFEADDDFFYISNDELPWSQAQYECLTKKGHLAELDGKFESWIPEWILGSIVNSIN